MDDGVGVITVVGWHIVGDCLVRLEFVASGNAGTLLSGFVDVCAMRINPKPVDLSQASVNVKWGRGIVRVESGDWIGERDGQGVSECKMRRRRSTFAMLANP